MGGDEHVALGQFDLAVTGRDWLFDHLVQFPASPVEQMADLGRCRYGLAAIVKGVSADTVSGALLEWRASSPRATIRVATPGVLGDLDGAPYDRILVSAAPDELPTELVDQLADDGVLVIPVAGTMLRVTNPGAVVTEHGRYRFVPLR